MLVFTKHARVRMYERGISPGEVKKVVETGMKWFVKNEGLEGRWHCKRGNIEIVFEKQDEDVLIVTVYWC